MAVVQISRIQIRRGRKNSGTGLPQLASGEIAWAIDTQELYIGNGAIAQPTYTNRGTSYSAAAATIIGNGYADNYQVGTFVGFTGLTGIPTAGSNVQIAGIDDIWYRLVNVSSCLLYTSPSPRDKRQSRMPSSA